ncbi:MAG: 50S ribosomal protein L10 [Planctomycetota bacterium]
MSRQIKRWMGDQLARRLEGAKDVIFLDITGVSAGQVASLRNRLRQDRIRMQVVKNAVATMAFQTIERTEVEKLLSGPCTIVYGGDDAVVMVKAIEEWAKKNKPILLKGGCVAGLIMTHADVKRLATIPSRQELVTRVVCGVAGPLKGLMVVLNGNLQKLVVALKAISEKGEKK